MGKQQFEPGTGHYLVAFGVLGVIFGAVLWWLSGDPQGFALAQSTTPAIIVAIGGAFLVLLGVILIAGRQRAD